MVHQLANHEAREARPGSACNFNILLTGPNYKAVAELAERVMRRMSVDESAAATFFVVHGEGREDAFQVPSESVPGFVIRTTTARRWNPEFERMMQALEVGPGVNIVATVVHQCPKIGEQAARLYCDDQVIRPLFDFVLYDESSQVDMSIAIPPLALLRNGFQLVLAGDLLQIPPIARCDPPVGTEHQVGSIQRYLVERFRVRRLRRVFPCVDGALIEGAVDTVERFQGGERHTIIVSFGVGDPDLIAGEERFLMQLERTNVAISRAMAKCIVFLSEEVAAHVPADRKAIETAHALKGVVDEWCKEKTEAIVASPEHGERNILIRSAIPASSRVDLDR